MTVLVARDGALAVLTLNRPDARNAIVPGTAAALLDAVRQAEANDAVVALIITGAGGHFCAGADLKAVARRDPFQNGDQLGPLGPTRLRTTKPVIAAIEGSAVAGGLELALWADLRVASASAVFGVYCRRWGVPLIDGGTVRLPRLIGQSRAMDMILTGRAVGAEEAFAWGLANRLVPEGEALPAALALGQSLATFPQSCLRNDRASVLAQWGLPIDAALCEEARLGRLSLRDGAAEGASRFVAGAGRGGVDAPP